MYRYSRVLAQICVIQFILTNGKVDNDEIKKKLDTYCLWIIYIHQFQMRVFMLSKRYWIHHH